MSGVRGIQPNWFYPNLVGQILDDTYYFFVQSTVSPYNQSPVWMNPDETSPWSYPIQFLASGTLPDNIYFDSATEYRLQIRQGTDPNSSPLIWEINNYFPDGSSSSGPSTTATQTTNQITNPQFSQIYFVSGATSTASSIPVAPGWTLVLAGISGTTTLTQIPIQGNQNIVTNAPYALGISTSGWTGVQLIQTFNQNGSLWANESVALTFVARSATALITPTIVANLVPSVGTPVQLFSQALTSNYALEQNSVPIVMSTNTNTPPNASTQLIFNWAGGIAIDITSIQLVGQSESANVDYAQETIERQIDQLYHLAYPVLPVGTIIDLFSFAAPSHYLLCNYVAYSRATYFQLFNAITNSETVTLTSSSATFTVPTGHGALYSVGYGLEGVGIIVGTTVTGISTDTITMSSAAIASGTVPVRFFAAASIIQETVTWTGASAFGVANGALYHVGQAISGIQIPTGTTISTIVSNAITISAPSSPAYSTQMSIVNFYDAGNGDGSTTFNVPDARRKNTVGSGGVVVSLPASAISGGLGVGNQFGNVGGQETHLQTNNEVGPHIHTIVPGFVGQTAGATGAVSGSQLMNENGQNTSGVVYTAGSQTAFNVIQPGLVTNKYIRFE